MSMSSVPCRSSILFLYRPVIPMDVDNLLPQTGSKYQLFSRAEILKEVDPQPFKETGTEPMCFGSDYCRLMRAFDASRPRCPICNRAPTVDSLSSPSHSGQ